MILGVVVVFNDRVAPLLDYIYLVATRDGIPRELGRSLPFEKADWFLDGF